MPLYEYRCDNSACPRCGDLFTVRQPVEDRHRGHCPDCGRAAELQVSVPAVPVVRGGTGAQSAG